MNSGPNRPPGKFCALAWVHRFTNIGGQVQVCCTGEEFGNDILDKNGKPIDIRDGLSDEQILNSDFMKTLRGELLAGRWPQVCRRCQITEDNGGVSRRMDENQHFAAHVPELIQTTQADGGIPVQVKSADYRLGNLCNLACRMCSPYSSTAWVKFAKDLKTADGNPKFPYLSAETPAHRWYESPRFLEYVKAQARHLEHLHFAGGEPLINPQMVPLLRHCVEQGAAKNIVLTYNTNLTRISDDIKKLWPQFKAVQLYCSIDAYGELNEYIRHPSRWKNIDANLKDIDRGFSEYGIEYAAIMTTTQIYNIFHLEDLYDYLFENMKNVSKLPKLLDLYSPSYLSTQALPPQLKAIAKGGLRPF